ncbi:MAG: heterodisulfide reductase-related iron-sulfur binding cluster, partial [Methanomassiliicoccales archaeon]|nr:heterodisulfide reductase-related iron-sulfur binding cluster [Methanomassiliicoccales archaeon]
ANERLGVIGMHYRGDVRVRHFVDLMDERLEEVRSKARVALGLRVAIHYGCHYLRPSYDEGRNVESPVVLERMVEAMGCHSIEFPEKLSCCGAGGGVWSGDERLSLAILERKMRFIKGSGADCILDICPFCHLQLDQGQRRLEQAYGVPVLHLSQLLGLAFGHKEKSLGVHTHMVSTRDVTRKARTLERPAGEG